MKIPPDWDTGAVSVDDTVSLQYYAQGSGDPIVLAHGFFASGLCWEPLIEELADEYRMIAYDARAHGRSDAPDTGYDIDTRVNDLVEVVSALDLVDPILLGHSMGASTIAVAVGSDPSLARGIVLGDPAGMHGDPERGPAEREKLVREELCHAKEAGIEEVAAEYEAAGIEEVAAENDRAVSWARRFAEAKVHCDPQSGAIARLGYPPLGDVFTEIQCPTLVLKADADPSTRASDLDVASGLTDGRLVHIPGASHTIFQDRYDVALTETRAFLAHRFE